MLKGYLTEGSTNGATISSMLSGTRSGRERPLGPFASCKAKSRRSRSASSTVSASKKSTIQSHSSRQKYKTPAQNRLLTQSADRVGMNPVTPKMQPNTPVALLRYPKLGEHVISLDGSPIIAQG